MGFPVRLMKWEYWPVRINVFKAIKLGSFCTFSKVVGMNPASPYCDPGSTSATPLYLYRLARSSDVAVFPGNKSHLLLLSTKSVGSHCRQLVPAEQLRQPKMFVQQTPSYKCVYRSHLMHVPTEYSMQLLGEMSWVKDNWTKRIRQVRVMSYFVLNFINIYLIIIVVDSAASKLYKSMEIWAVRGFQALFLMANGKEN